MKIRPWTSVRKCLMVSFLFGVSTVCFGEVKYRAEDYQKVARSLSIGDFNFENLDPSIPNHQYLIRNSIALSLSEITAKTLKTSNKPFLGVFYLSDGVLTEAEILVEIEKAIEEVIEAHAEKLLNATDNNEDKISHHTSEVLRTFKNSLKQFTESTAERFPLSELYQNLESTNQAMFETLDACSKSIIKSIEKYVVVKKWFQEEIETVKKLGVDGYIEMFFASQEMGNPFPDLPPGGQLMLPEKNSPKKKR